MGKPRNHKPETPSLRESYRLRGVIYRKLKQERLFPKRSRFLYADPIWKLTLEYLTSIIEANDPKVQTIELRNRRYTLQQIALGKLSALDVLINSARDDMNLPPDEFDEIEDRIDTCMKYIHSWVKSDEYKYGAPTELETLNRLAEMALQEQSPY